MTAHKSLTNMVLTVGLGIGILSVAACDSTAPGKAGQSTTSKAQVKTGGTVVFRESNGGFYGILADKGGQFEPKNLDPKFQSDGLHITFTGVLDTSRVGDHRWGNPIDLSNVKAEQ